MVKRQRMSAEQRQLQAAQIERERTLRVENARETTRAFDEQIAFRRRLRGIMSLMQGGFQGFGKTDLGT